MFKKEGDSQPDGLFQESSLWSPARHSAGLLLLCICSGLCGEKHVARWPQIKNVWEGGKQKLHKNLNNNELTLCVTQILVCEGDHRAEDIIIFGRDNLYVCFVATVTVLTCTPAPVYSAWWLRLGVCGLRISPDLPKPVETLFYSGVWSSCRIQILFFYILVDQKSNTPLTCLQSGTATSYRPWDAYWMTRLWSVRRRAGIS